MLIKSRGCEGRRGKERGGAGKRKGFGDEDCLVLNTSKECKRMVLGFWNSKAERTLMRRWSRLDVGGSYVKRYLITIVKVKIDIKHGFLQVSP